MNRLLFLLPLILIFSCNSQKNKINVESNEAIDVSWAVKQLEQTIEARTSLSIPKIHVRSRSAERNDEGYDLEVSDGITITGNDPNGTIYGILELTEQIKHARSIDDLKSRHESARFPFRAIKANLPWDSYRRSEALQLHMETMQDISYWESFLDMLNWKNGKISGVRFLEWPKPEASILISSTGIFLYHQSLRKTTKPLNTARVVNSLLMETLRK
jgi:hypothetical protein